MKVIYVVKCVYGQISGTAQANMWSAEEEDYFSKKEKKKKTMIIYSVVSCVLFRHSKYFRHSTRPGFSAGFIEPWRFYVDACVARTSWLVA